MIKYIKADDEPKQAVCVNWSVVHQSSSISQYTDYACSQQQGLLLSTAVVISQTVDSKKPCGLEQQW